MSEPTYVSEIVPVLSPDNRLCGRVDACERFHANALHRYVVGSEWSGYGYSSLLEHMTAALGRLRIRYPHLTRVVRCNATLWVLTSD